MKGNRNSRRKRGREQQERQGNRRGDRLPNEGFRDAGERRDEREADGS